MFPDRHASTSIFHYFTQVKMKRTQLHLSYSSISCAHLLAKFFPTVYCAPLILTETKETRDPIVKEIDKLELVLKEINPSLLDEA
mmetsp:Transcript_39439/g.101104  ORF Transcript_39439/g.101104 Transcript_39439/m.101104 type:complete len:85 (+) Transcript_39439:1091-1345(+)